MRRAISISSSYDGWSTTICIRNRSRCASGSAYTPSDSIGFCVASTRNGFGSGSVWPAIDTWRSAMTSSSADCTLAGARLISSASTMFANTGPHSMSNSSRDGRQIRVPTMSAGHEVGGELEAGERAADDVGERRHGERLRQTGNALDQAVAAGEQADHRPLDHAVLADDDPLDLEQRVFEEFGVPLGISGLRTIRRLTSITPSFASDLER